VNPADDRFGPPVAERTYWPRWASAAVLASGLVVVAFETTSWLVLLGLGFLVLGAYGFFLRRPVHPATPLG
jgi:predicted cobalt transporter CbtA